VALGNRRAGAKPGTASPADAERHATAGRDRAKALALRVLAFHARSEAQVRARLAKAGLEDHADEVIAWLRRLRYVDDAAYARGRALALLARLGPYQAERRLRAAGVAPELARSAVAAAAEERAQEREPGEPAELVLCRAALRARLRGASTAELDERGRARLARFLLGRGFSGAVVARVLELRADVDG
jgi:regulatory protein